MRYNVEDIEDQLLATLVTAFTTGTPAALTVNIATHAGDVNPMMFQSPAYMEGFVSKLPFVFVQYNGRERTGSDSPAQINKHRLTFRFYVGAESLRAKKEAARSAYAMLRTIYDEIHGHWIKGAVVATGLPSLGGTTITTTGFNPLGPFIEAGGRDEMLIVNLPEIVVYQTDYTVELVA